MTNVGTGILEKSRPMLGPSFRLRNRVSRLCWQLVWTLLFRPSPPPMHGWRCWLLSCFGAKLGAQCHVYSDVQIWAPWNLHMADQACLGRRVICYNIAPVTLGQRCVVSQGTHLCTGSHDYESESFQLIAKPISIGADSWICAEAFLGPGVTIGNGAVVGARSVVIRSLPEWMVCAGHPCRPIKVRAIPSYACS